MGAPTASPAWQRLAGLHADGDDAARNPRVELGQLLDELDAIGASDKMTFSGFYDLKYQAA